MSEKLIEFRVIVTTDSATDKERAVREALHHGLSLAESDGSFDGVTGYAVSYVTTMELCK